MLQRCTPRWEDQGQLIAPGPTRFQQASDGTSEREEYLQERLIARGCCRHFGHNHNKDKLWDHKSKTGSMNQYDGSTSSRQCSDEGVWHELHVRSDHRQTSMYIKRRDSMVVQFATKNRDDETGPNRVGGAGHELQVGGVGPREH